jgi:DNA-binding protein H-NS
VTLSEKTDQELADEKKRIEAELEKRRKKDANTKFNDVMEVIEKYGTHFTQAKRNALIEALGGASQKAKATAEQADKPAKPDKAVKPKKYKIGDEEWGGQGGEKMAPKAFKEFRKQNPNLPWPANPAYKG